MNNNINVNINLLGQYRFSVVEKNEIVYSTPWCKNTILSAGLVDLYNYNIDSILSYLDIGLSDSMPGLSGYSLNGVISSSEFTNINRDNIETYSEDLSSRTYLTTFTTNKAVSGFSIKEFAIKRDVDTTAFARNTFLTSYDVTSGQIVNFEYKLTVNWASINTTTLPIVGNSPLYTYTLPITTVNYNVPYNRVYSSNNYLMLLGNIYDAENNIDNSLPDLSDNFPLNFDWGIQQESYSTFKPIEVSNGINNFNRTYNVVSRYSNIVCPLNGGVYDNIKSALLVYGGNIDIPTNKFNITRFAFPLAVYNQALSCNNFIEEYSSISRSNTLTLDYNYSWGECVVANAFAEADYLIITYTFTDGQDLDTKTSLLNPITSLPVGYCDGYGNLARYIQWGGDNIGTGVESVLIKVDALRDDYPSTNIIDINLAAKWWYSRDSGDVTIRITGYKGGTNYISNFQFINEGGQLLDIQDLPTQNILLNEANCNGGNNCYERLGKLSFDVYTGAISYTTLSGNTCA